MPDYDAFLLVSFGGPEGPGDVMPFLRNVTRGRGIPDERLAAVAEHYYAFGGVSPINQQCRDLIEALRAAFPAAGLDLPIYWGNRNWDPYLTETVATMAADGVRHAVAFATSAYSSFSSCRQYLDDIDRARAEVGEQVRLTLADVREWSPERPVELVNFGQSVSFPLLFGAALSLFGVATLLHLLLVSVHRRRAEAGLLKVLGFLRRQVAAVVGWQAIAVVLVGIVAGVPLGIAGGKVAWRLFATSFGVVPVSVVQPVPLILLAVAVLLVTTLLAVLPALLAARSRPADLLRTE